jgi:hypothetical protein
MPIMLAILKMFIFLMCSNVQLAQQHAKMDLFADIVGEDAGPEDYHR